MTHPLVTQLRFARKEFVRALAGVPIEDATRRIGPMNCLSWTVGHMASQEHTLWVRLAQGHDVAPGLSELVGYGQPASAPPWDAMWETWRRVSAAADPYLDTIVPETLHAHLLSEGNPLDEDIGITLLRNIYHYWFHLGEAHAVRQMLGHTHLPQFVGHMGDVRVGPDG